MNQRNIEKPTKPYTEHGNSTISYNRREQHIASAQQFIHLKMAN
jgi:hypothetical protein